MGLLNLGIYIGIAVFYNIFVHHLTSTLYKDVPYEEKFKKSVTMIFVSGIVAIVASKLLLKDDQKYKNSVVSMGLGIGGGLLILTSVFANWEYVSGEIKLMISGALLIGLIWFAYRYFDESEDEDGDGEELIELDDDDLE
jgi:hypothetical protein